VGVGRAIDGDGTEDGGTRGYELTPGTQVEFVDEGGVIRLLVRRRVPVSDPVAGFGLVKVKRTKTGNQRRLSQFDSADLLKQRRRKI